MPSLVAAALAAGCASVEPDQALAGLDTWSARQGVAAPRLAADAGEVARRAARTEALLDAPLTEAAAVELAVDASPALQAMLADAWAQQARDAVAAAWPSPVFGFERMAGHDSVALTRMLSVGLAELLALPARREAARLQGQARRLALASEVTATIVAVRQQWVRAVAAAEAVPVLEHALETAQAGAELARRMQAVGNFSRTQRAREQLALHEAAAALARAKLAAATEREALVRRLGLDDTQSVRLRLPDRLPTAPDAPRAVGDVLRDAQQQRLDLQLAEQAWQAARRAETPAVAAAFDAEIAAIRERAGDERERGFELALRLPLDAPARTQAASATTLAAWQRWRQAQVDAASTLRASHAAYVATHEVLRQQREHVLPLRRTIADEAVLRYNGMLIGVFELLAEARAQAAAVQATIDAQRDFWLADMALQAAVLGVPAAPAALGAGAAATAEPAAGH